MKVFLTIAAVAALTGCVTSAVLIAQDGPRYKMDVDPVLKGLKADIDGTAFSGKYVMNQNVGFGSAQSYGLSPVTSFGTMVVAGNNGQAMLTAANGEYIECAFSANGTNVVGKCRSSKGREFALTTE